MGSALVDESAVRCPGALASLPSIPDYRKEAAEGKMSAPESETTLVSEGGGLHPEPGKQVPEDGSSAPCIRTAV